MSYINDYEDNHNKIPYDDIPISRNEIDGRRRQINAGSYSKSKKTSAFMAILIVLNIILCSVCIYAIKHSKIKTINNYTLELNSNSEIAAAYKTTAYLSTICVSAGGTCSTMTTFYSSAASRGSGVIFKVDESTNTIYFVTCYHVVSGYEDRVWVLLATSLKPIKATVVAYSHHYDIAVLKYKASSENDLEETLSGCQPIKFYDSAFISSGSGETAFAIGNSLSNGLSITEGTVSAANVWVTVNGVRLRELQVSAPINPGNSGGGLYNGHGEFIGLVNAKKTSVNSGGENIAVDGTAYAIPSTVVIGVANSLISTKNKPKYVDIGAIFTFDDELGKTMNFVEYDGIYTVQNPQIKQISACTVVVESVSFGSAASGKLKRGDAIESIEFKYINQEGVATTKRIRMFNEFVFDEYAFSIVSGSDIKFYLVEGDGSTPSTSYVVVKASDFVTVSD